MSSSLAFINAKELATRVRDQKQVSGRDYIVIDVRDVDFVGGHIPGAENVPAHTLFERMDELINRYQRVPLVVFHCAMSQVRGPKSARSYLRAVNARLETAPQDSPLHKQQVVVLTGGFNN
ncbi:Cdc25 phosphatase Ibp1, partial [Coemansia aciculifera]